MSTSFNVIYLGNFASLDPVDGDQNLSQSDVNGGTYGSAGNGLSNVVNLRVLAPNGGGFSGGQSRDAYDLNTKAD